MAGVVDDHRDEVRGLDSSADETVVDARFARRWDLANVRRSEAELAALRDIVYELEVKRGVKITRNDILRLGLNLVIDDYRSRGDDSLILRLFGKRRSRV